MSEENQPGGEKEPLLVTIISTGLVLQIDDLGATNTLRR